MVRVSFTLFTLFCLVVVSPASAKPKLPELEQPSLRAKVVSCAFGLLAVGYLAWTTDGFAPRPAAVLADKLAAAKIVLDSPLSVDHVPQKHFVDEIKALHPEDMLTVTLEIGGSQVRIAKTLMELGKDPHTLVFSEGLYFDLTPELLKELRAKPTQADGPLSLGLVHEETRKAAENALRNLYSETREAFPHGWELPNPRNMERARHQLVCLSVHGADHVLWALGEFDSLYKTSSEEFELQAMQMRKLQEQGATFWNRSKIKQFKMQGREVEALKEAVTRLNLTGRRRGVLIFGAAHDFQQYRGPLLKIRTGK